MGKKVNEKLLNVFWVHKAIKDVIVRRNVQQINVPLE
jgi:hypothetical protein